MSTILDALRKVQRERDRGSPDLRHALAQDDARSRDGFGTGHWMVVAGLVLLAVGVSAYLFVGGDRPGAPIASGDSVEMTAAKSGGKANVSPEKAMQTAMQGQILKLRRAKIEKRREILARRKVEAIEARLEADRRRSEALVPEPEFDEFFASAPPPVASPAPSRTVDPAPRPAPPKREPEPEPAPVRTAVRDPEPEPEPIRVAAVKREEHEPLEPRLEKAADDFGSGNEPLMGLRFPDLRLESVRWHPDSTRREARLLVDQTRSVSAREGDVIVGVAVHRIDPGAVELRLGEVTRLVRIGQ